MTRKLIDHTEPHSLISHNNPNEEILQIFKDNKKNKKANPFNKINKYVTVANRRSDSKLSMSAFNRIEGSTGGDFSTNIEARKDQKARSKEYTPLIENKDEVVKNRFQSVNRKYSDNKKIEGTKRSLSKNEVKTPSKFFQTSTKKQTQLREINRSVKEAYCRQGPRREKLSTIAVVSQSTEYKIPRSKIGSGQEKRASISTNGKRSPSGIEVKDSEINYSDLPSIKIGVEKEEKKQQAEKTGKVNIGEKEKSKEREENGDVKRRFVPLFPSTKQNEQKIHSSKMTKTPSLPIKIRQRKRKIKHRIKLKNFDLEETKKKVKFVLPEV